MPVSYKGYDKKYFIVLRFYMSNLLNLNKRKDSEIVFGGIKIKSTQFYYVWYFGCKAVMRLHAIITKSDKTKYLQETLGLNQVVSTIIRVFLQCLYNSCTVCSEGLCVYSILLMFLLLIVISLIYTLTKLDTYYVAW